MRVAILDDTHRAWDGTEGVRRLRERAEVQVFTGAFGDPAALRGFDALIANRERTRFDRELLERLPDVRLLVQTGNHASHIDFGAAHDCGIFVARASGGYSIRMYREMEARLMEPPVFEATASSVTVILRNRMLVDVEDQSWLSQLDRDDIGGDERRTVVAARRAGAVAPRDLRAMLPDADVDALLSRMVAKGLLSRVGRRGGARYVLSDALVRRAGNPGMAAHNRRRQVLLDEIRRRGSLSTNEAATLLDVAPAVARRLLNDLVRAGLARAAGRTRARRYHLR